MKNCKFYNMLDIDENVSIDSFIQSYIIGDGNKYDYESN